MKKLFLAWLALLVVAALGVSSAFGQSGVSGGTLRHDHGSLSKGGFLFTESAETALTGVANVDFAVPAGTNRIYVQGSGISTASASSFLSLVLGDAGGIEASGYTGSVATLTNAVAVSVGGIGVGFTLCNGAVGIAEVFNVVAVLRRMNGNKWSAQSTMSNTAGTGLICVLTGSKTLSAEITTVRVNSSVGNFDGGLVRLRFEK